MEAHPSPSSRDLTKTSGSRRRPLARARPARSLDVVAKLGWLATTRSWVYLSQADTHLAQFPSNSRCVWECRLLSLLFAAQLQGASRVRPRTGIAGAGWEKHGLKATSFPELLGA